MLIIKNYQANNRYLSEPIYPAFKIGVFLSFGSMENKIKLTFEDVPASI